MTISLTVPDILVARAKAGDLEALEALYRAFETPVYNLARRICRSPEDAEDVLQETFLKAYTHLDRFQGDSRFYTWIVRIAVNESLMKLRKRKSDRTVSLDEPVETGEDEYMPREVVDWGENPEQRYARQEMNDILSRALNELEPSFRIVVYLRDVENLSTEETAEMLDLSVPAVKSRLLRGRLKLRERLNQHFRQERASTGGGKAQG